MPALLLNLDVPDLAEAERFYTQAFGFHVGRRFAGTIEMLGGEAPLYLLEKASGTEPFPAARATRTYERHWSPMHLDLLVADLDAALARALGAGATQEGPATTHAWGRLVQLADHFGHGLCLVQFLGAGYDVLVLEREAQPPQRRSSRA